MAQTVLILGGTGTGKTTAARTLNPDETFIICPDEKSLPFKNWKKNYKTTYKSDGKVDLGETNFYKTSSPSVIVNLLKKISSDKPQIKVIVFDTITSMMISEYMSKLHEKGFEKFNALASDTYQLLKSLNGLRDDLTVFVLSHTEDNYDSDGVLKTSFKVPGGKLIGQNIKVEGMFTIVLYTDVTMVDSMPTYKLMTQNNGKNTCKSPMGMFEDLIIDNDFQYIINKIQEFDEKD